MLSLDGFIKLAKPNKLTLFFSHSYLSNSTKIASLLIEKESKKVANLFTTPDDFIKLCKVNPNVAIELLHKQKKEIIKLFSHDTSNEMIRKLRNTSESISTLIEWIASESVSHAKVKNTMR